MRVVRVNTPRQFVAHFIATIGTVVILIWPIAAAASKSTSYQIQEDFIGGVGGSYASSATYKSIDSAGAAAIGNGSSTSYRSQSGATTTNDPNLSFSVNTSSVSLGSLTTATTGTATAAFSVLNYTSYGYVVQIVGNTPNFGAHNLTALSSGGGSSAGTEQFGINLVADTVPSALIGASAGPLQVPSSSFSNGGAATGYGTANTYRYNSGDTIAQATQSSGQTTYTVSYVANIGNTTPPGNYSGAETLICTGTY